MGNYCSPSKTHLVKGKYRVELEEATKIFDKCPPTQLKNKVRKAFKIQTSFKLQVYDDDFKEWADVTDYKTLPPTCKLKVKTGKKIILFRC